MAELRAANARLLKEASERRVVEQQLRESDALYRRTVELTRQIVWTRDAAGEVLQMDPRFYELTGLSPDTLPPMAIIEEDRARALAEWRQSVVDECALDSDYRLRLADGSVRRFKVRAEPQRGPDGRITRWYGTFVDVHDQWLAAEAQCLAEERLRESQELHRYTLELSQHIAWTADADGSFRGRSQRYTDVTGLPSDTPPREAVHPDDVEQLAAAWREAVATGQPFVLDFRLRMKDGTYRMFRSRAAPRRDDSGRIVRWYGTSQDIEDQRRSEHAQHVAEERYQLVARATNDVIWDLDPVTGQIEWPNAEGSLFGYGGFGPTALGWWVQRIHPEDRDLTAASLNRAIAGLQTHWAASYRFRTASGDYADIYDRAFIIRDGGGNALRMVGAMADISDRVRAEAQLRYMQSELIHVSRVSAMGTMASTLAHELNQPLTAVGNYVSGSLRILEQIDHPLVDQVRTALQSAEAGAMRAGRIVRGLRELVARGNVRMKPEDIGTLIHDACLLAFVDAHALGILHRIDIDPAVQWVEADSIQFQQVLINLVRNAAQATAGQPVREIVVAARAVPGRMVEVSVADTGIGLTPEVREALFSPFRSTKQDGMGIGLSISRTIVEAHGGHIWADDRDGGGTVFRFTVPSGLMPDAIDLGRVAAA